MSAGGDEPTPPGDRNGPIRSPGSIRPMTRQALGGRSARILVTLLVVGAAVWQNLRAEPVSTKRPERRPAASSPSPSPSPSPTPQGTGPALTGFDVVVLGGRVMDPETGFDKVTNVGIKGSRIEAITDRRLEGKTTIDARGLVVAPGFIDNLSYEPNAYGIWYKVADGVTTTLGMHGLDGSAKEFFTTYAKRGLPVHYGGAFDDPYWRARLGIGAYKSPTAAQIRRLAQVAEQNIKDGWIGVDFEPEYSPGTSKAEMVELAKVGARHRVASFFHVRYSDVEEPGTNLDALQEVIEIARASRAAAHIEHINSTGGTFSMAASLAMLEKARAEGIDVTACVYPYDFWSTFLGSARFDPGWQKRFRITYSDLEIPATGERLTQASFERYRRQNKVVIAHAIPEADVRTALKSPLVMMGSDSILVENEGRHPRAAGTFARVLGRYVREEKVLSLMDALAKMTIMPAKRVEAGAPAMRTKGRLQVGMDADITIFDPRTVRDRATVKDPSQYSAGIEWVLVMGRVVKDRKGLRRTVLAGVPIKSAASLGEA